MAYTWPSGAPGQVYEIQIIGTVSGQQTITSYQYQIASISGAPTILDIMNGLITRFTAAGGVYTTYLNSVPTNWTADNIRCQCIYPIRYVAENYAPPGAIGLGLGAANATQLAGVLTRQTVVAGRKGRGSIHVPIPTVIASTNDGMLTAPQQGLLNLHAIQVLQQLNPPGVCISDPVLYHRKTATTPPSFTLLGQMTLQTTTRVMRRRTIGVGK